MAIDPLTAFVRAMDGEFYLTSEVAAVLGVSREYLWDLRDRDPEMLGPSWKLDYSDRAIPLYVPADVSRLAAYLAAHPVARPRGSAARRGVVRRGRELASSP